MKWNGEVIFHFCQQHQKSVAGLQNTHWSHDQTSQVCQTSHQQSSVKGYCWSKFQLYTMLYVL